MQMKAFRSLNFAKLYSTSSTSNAYLVSPITSGAPAGFCLSQIRSMDFPSVHFRRSRPDAWPASLILGRYWAIRPPVASGREGPGPHLLALRRMAAGEVRCKYRECEAD